MAGRTVSKYNRVYLGDSTHGVDLSCHVLDVGDLSIDFDGDPIAAYCWGVKGTLLSNATITAGPINAILSAGEAGDLHTTMTALQGRPISMGIAIGINQVPTLGDPIFVLSTDLKSYTGLESAGGMVTMNATLGGGADSTAGMKYGKAWGTILHGLAAASAANASTADIFDGGAASAAGGFMFYCLTSLDGGNVTLSIEDSADNSTYTALTGATSGALTEAGCGIVQLGTNATVRRYLRWQLALAGGATTATFLIAFVRG